MSINVFREYCVIVAFLTWTLLKKLSGGSVVGLRSCSTAKKTDFKSGFGQLDPHKPHSVAKIQKKERKIEAILTR